ncbi:MAG: tetratricopeptide repeat protein [Bacteroidales bacterium]|nr:tetratricopeptide repeat protein [Bacteroidales bacterium]
MVKRINIILFFVSIILIDYQAIGQDLDLSVQNKINEYKSEVEKFKTENNTIQQANFLNKVAYLYWDNEGYSDAIKYFSESLEINQTNKNLNGVKSLYYNIGLIYSDQEDYQNSLTNLAMI